MWKFGDDAVLENTSAPFLIRTEETDGNCIRFVVALSCKGARNLAAQSTGEEVLSRILSDACPLCPDEEHQYEIIFDRYILYQVRNESYVWGRDPYEIGKGGHFVLFERSRLLEFLPQVTCCDFVPSWKHYGISCENHVVDVISPCEPIIRPIISKQTSEERVKQMEEYFDSLLAAAKKDSTRIKEDERLQEQLRLLVQYYESPLWQQDYERDERGEFPKDLKRGVLSQDGIDHLLLFLSEVERERLP